MIDPVFNMYKTKFTIIDDLKLLDKSKDKVRIFINLEMVLKTLFSTKNNNQLQAIGDIANDKLSVISNIINLGQHYRLYCTKYGRESEIYLYYNYPHMRYKNSDIITGYRSYYINRVLKNENCMYLVDILKGAVEFLDVFGKYIDKVYIIPVGSVESALVPYIIKIKRFEPNSQDIIVSNTKYDLQYVNHGFTVLYPHQDNSMLINQSNAITALKDIYKVNTTMDIPSSFIPFIISMLGDRYKGIYKMFGVGLSTVLKTINEGINRHLITSSTTNIDMLSSIIKEQYRDTFIDNYKCVELQLQYNRLSKSDIHEILSYVKDKFDENTLSTINEKYFQMHPLMLINPRSEQIRNEEYRGKSIFAK